MNPNAVLSEIRGHCHKVHAGDELATWHAEEVVKLFEELDTWLTSGGAIPDDWWYGPVMPDQMKL